jgi:alpha-mannosidase
MEIKAYTGENSTIFLNRFTANGHDIHNHVIRLSLIKSATAPDHSADQGHHDFTYSLYPHVGGWLDAGTHRMACELNTPLFAVLVKAGVSNGPVDTMGFIQLNQEHVMIDTVKKSEDGAFIIVRLYEYGGIRSIVKVQLDTHLGKIATLEETDLMEENPVLLEAAEHHVNVPMKPYEIKTLRIRLSTM